MEMKAIAARLVFLVALLPTCESSGPSLRRAAHFMDAKLRNEAFGSMLPSMQGLQLSRLSAECNSGHCSQISKIIKRPLSLRGGDSTRKAEQHAPSVHAAQASDTLTADPTTDRLTGKASVHEKHGTPAADDTGDRAADHEAENIEDGDTFEDDAVVDDGIQMPIDELVALGRVAIAEQNYSLAADYLSAAVGKQVITRLCATHSLLRGAYADCLSP